MSTELISKPSVPHLLNLPRELICKIIHITYDSNISIAPLVLSCKELYYAYRHLLYLTRVAYVEEYVHLAKGSRKKKPNTGLLDVLETTPELMSDIYVFNVHLNLSTLFINHQNNRVVKFIPKHLSGFKRLLVLNISLNSAPLLLRVFTSLPQSLKVLVVRLEVTRLQLSLTRLKHVKKVHFVSHCPNLKYFEIISHNCELTFGHLHPELSKFKYSSEIPEEITFQDNSNRPNMKFLQNINHKTREFKVKSQISSIFYKFLCMNNTSLLKIEIVGIDMNLIFNKEFLNQSPSLVFPELRLLSFDSTSRVNLNKWLREFQLCNLKPSYADRPPLLICHDRLSRRLYYKYSDILRAENGNMSEIEVWLFDQNICEKYLMFAKELNLEF